MRIDLCLQCFQFTFSFLLLFVYILLHQRLDLAGHQIERSSEASDLIFRDHFHMGVKLSVLHFPHGIPEGTDRFCDLPGDDA